jgi:ACR3 family arsenite transporter
MSMEHPMFTKILYATDLSETAKKAARYAVNLADTYGAELTVINIVLDRVEELSAGISYDLTGHYPADILEKFNKDGIEASKKTISERIHLICEEEGGRRLDGPVIVKVGQPVEQIVTTATEGCFDLVVMGTHGHGILEDLLRGSVARGVVKKCPVPVLTVRL